MLLIMQVIHTVKYSRRNFNFLFLNSNRYSFYSFTTAEKHFLLNKRLYVIGSQWLEDSLERGQKLLEDTYNLKPSGLEESNCKEV
jgi:DNA ligase-4